MAVFALPPPPSPTATPSLSLFPRPGDHASALAKADEHYLASLSHPERVRVYAVSGKTVREPAAVLERAALHLQRVVEPVARIKFAMIAGDFLRDPGGEWWLLNVKAFRLTRPSVERVRFLRAGGLEEPDAAATRRASALGISLVGAGLSPAEAAEAAQRQRAQRARPQDRTCAACGQSFTFYQERGPQEAVRVGAKAGQGQPSEGASSQWTAEFGYKLTGNMIHRMVEHCKRRKPDVRCFDHFLATQGASAAGGAALAAPYESVKVCKLCYDLYTRFTQLQRASDAAARAMHVPRPRRRARDSGVGVQVPAAKLPPKVRAPARQPLPALAAPSRDVGRCVRALHSCISSASTAFSTPSRIWRWRPPCTAWTATRRARSSTRR